MDLWKRVAISKIKSQLSAYIKRVKAGETILILDRDEPVARLERVIGDEPPDERIARLEREGLVRRASKPASFQALQETAPKPRESVLEALVEERREEGR